MAVLAVVLAVGHGISDGGGGTAASCVGPQLSPEPDPQPDARVPVSLGDMPRGEQVTLYGRWYLAECHDTVEIGDTWEPGPPMTDVPLTLTSAGSERVLATAHPDQQGSFAVTVRIPDDLPLGPATIRDDLGQTLRSARHREQVSSDVGTIVGVATCAAAPTLDQDGPILLAALSDAGADPRVAVWDDPAVDWASFDAVLVRSTWDYPLRREDFLTWSRTCRTTANPAAVIEWNTDKRYLQELADAGVPTVPTVFVPPGSRWPGVEGDSVIKPTVSGSAADTGRFGADDGAAAAALVAHLHAQGRTAMVQPYLPGIDAEGESSLVYLGGVFSHAVRRAPLLAGTGVRRPVVVADVLSTIRPAQVTVAQREVAEAALDAVPAGRERLSYARVDLIPGRDGPVVLELEATDCFLFLAFAKPDAVNRMVRHVLARTS